MKPASFRYFAPKTLEAALALKAEHGDEARFLAGGQSLVPAMNFRMAQPAILIDVNTIAGLDSIVADGQGLSIGATARYHHLERSTAVAEAAPLLVELLPHVSHFQIRTRTTLGGNVAHADPASEMPAAILALGGRMRAQSQTGERWIAANDFFFGPLTTALDDTEMLVEVVLPALPPRTGVAFQEVTRRRGDYALMGVAAVMTFDDAGICRTARLTYCNAADRPVCADAACAALVGTSVGPADIAEAVSHVGAGIDPAGGLHGSADYQRHLAGVLTARVIRAAQDRALGGAARRAA